MASRAGQKGTVGMIIPECDMPFTKDGLRPDIIINPHALPTRMTIGQLVECISAKAVAIQGGFADCTAFTNHSKENIGKFGELLTSLGYHSSGNQVMYNGMTGQRLKHMIFVGPTYYHRLKHLVEDKLHSRSRGPRTILTRQPPEGRSREGGLRLGEMERDALIAHGIAKFLKEKLLDTSDAYSTYVCNKCGLFAQRLYRKESKRYISNNDIFYCSACKNYTEISKIMIPYACKLLFQELLALNIAPRIRTKQSSYN
jgi:DNA-directed RNA polymerase II subunit RPB2